MRMLSRPFHRRGTPSAIRAAGLTLIEGLLASVILAFAVMAITQAVASGHMQTYAALHRQRAVELAEALMEEALALPYCDPNDATCGTSPAGPETGENGRTAWDNADDFHGYSEAAGALADHAGATYPASYQSFQRSVTAAYGSTTVFGSAVPGLTVTVTVQDSAGSTWTITRLKAQP